MQVFDTVDILGANALFIHEIAVIGDVVIDMPHDFNQFFRLQFFNLFNRHGFSFRLIIMFFRMVHLVFVSLAVVSQCESFFIHRGKALFYAALDCCDPFFIGNIKIARQPPH